MPYTSYDKINLLLGPKMIVFIEEIVGNIDESAANRIILEFILNNQKEVVLNIGKEQKDLS